MKVSKGRSSNKGRVADFEMVARKTLGTVIMVVRIFLGEEKWWDGVVLIFVEKTKKIM